MKATVGQLSQFYDSDWGALLGGGSCDWYHEDCNWINDDILQQSPDTIITLDDSGVIMWCGCRTNPLASKIHRPISVYRKWFKLQADIVVTISVPKSKLTELQDAVATLGGKIVK